MYQKFDFKPDDWGFHVLERDIRIYSPKLHYKVHIDAIGYFDGWFCVLVVDDDKAMGIQRLHCARKMMYRFIKRYAFTSNGYDRHHVDLKKFTVRLLYYDPFKMGVEEIKASEAVDRLINHSIKLEQHRVRSNMLKFRRLFGVSFENIIDIKIDKKSIKGFKKLNA